MPSGVSTPFHRKSPDRDYEHKLAGEAEAWPIALTYNNPPEGRSRRTLRLLADVVTLDAIQFDPIAHVTVGKTQKTNSVLIDSDHG